MLKSQFKLPVT